MLGFGIPCVKPPAVQIANNPPPPLVTATEPHRVRVAEDIARQRRCGTHDGHAHQPLARRRPFAVSVESAAGDDNPRLELTAAAATIAGAEVITAVGTHVSFVLLDAPTHPAFAKIDGVGVEFGRVFEVAHVRIMHPSA